MKYWEIIADNIKKRGWSLGYVSAIDSNGRMIWIADTRRGDGQRFVARADELLTAFVELESAIRALRRIVFAIRRVFLQNCVNELSGIANLLKNRKDIRLSVRISDKNTN